jgi:hypothetical protein
MGPWLPDKVSNLESPDSESGVLPITLSGNVGEFRSVAASESVGLTVTVWAKHPEILKTVVISHAVDMVNLNR